MGQIIALMKINTVIYTFPIKGRAQHILLVQSYSISLVTKFHTLNKNIELINSKKSLSYLIIIHTVPPIQTIFKIITPEISFYPRELNLEIPPFGYEFDYFI